MKKIVHSLKTVLLLAVALVGVSYVQAAWTPPTSPPPGGNLSAPINVGPNEQTKEGLLNIAGGLFVGGVGLTTDSLVVTGEPEGAPNTFDPGARLHTAGGLIIETGTSDPASPEDGRIWLRTDL